ncbi:MFS transporter [Streptomyces katrae]|uniref:MFS transporter n=1 Tax=Streptomyces katrae TaxID=68223 RepID=A0ABT7GN44_9ACTN|nr:MFS transporter [Streptomyces katrae]MDK9494706.1 MFS transporter [Streptomyces katrae]
MHTLKRAFDSLSVRNFRLFFLGQLLSVTCTWMMVIAQDWLVLELSGNSGTALGVVTALQFAPVLLLTLYGGRLADRHDKRRILILANLVSGALSFLLGAWILLGEVRLWHIWLFALALGTVGAVEVPTRIAFTGEMVGGDLLPNASALSGAYFNAARVAGPAAAGLLIARLGVGPVVLINACSYLGAVAGLALMRPSELHGPPAPASDPRITDGLRYVARRPDLVLPLALTGVLGLAGFNFQLTLPLLAKTEFRTGSAAFGLLSSSLAAGSLLAAFATTARRTRPTAAVVTGSALAFGATEALTGLAPTLPTACLLLSLTGFAMMYFAQAANHRIQLGSDPAYRGRVMGLFTLIFMGTTPLGALLTGWLSDHWGPRWSLSTGGLISLTATALTLALPLTPEPDRELDNSRT